MTIAISPVINNEITLKDVENYLAKAFYWTAVVVLFYVRLLTMAERFLTKNVPLIISFCRDLMDTSPDQPPANDAQLIQLQQESPPSTVRKTEAQHSVIRASPDRGFY